MNEFKGIFFYKFEVLHVYAYFTVQLVRDNSYFQFS